MLQLKPDYEQSRARIEAFWEHRVLDRPVTMFHLARPPDQQHPLPPSHHASPAARWLDTQYQAELALITLSNQEFLGDTLPIACPNLGHSVFAALYGCPLHFGDDGTTWADPILKTWTQTEQIRLDWGHTYLRKLIELTEALLGLGQSRFITGMPDWRTGGDALAAFRGPQQLAMDLAEHPQEVKALLARVEKDFFQVYDMFYEKLRSRGQPITAWTPLVSESKYAIPGNGFSASISKEWFDEFFLPELTRECRYFEHTIYHLEGPDALRHLDSILSIHKLDALLWDPGPGNEGFSRWAKIYQRAQAAGKGVQVNVRLEEVPLVMQTLSPRGLFLNVSGVRNRETGLAMLQTLEHWTAEMRKVNR